MTQSVILLIGLAVGVDYSIFYLARERRERALGNGTVDAIEIAAATSGRAVLVSGLTVIVAMSGMFLSGNSLFSGLAVGTILVVLCADHRVADGAARAAGRRSRRRAPLRARATP